MTVMGWNSTNKAQWWFLCCQYLLPYVCRSCTMFAASQQTEYMTDWSVSSVCVCVYDRNCASWDFIHLMFRLQFATTVSVHISVRVQEDSQQDSVLSVTDRCWLNLEVKAKRRFSCWLHVCYFKHCKWILLTCYYLLKRLQFYTWGWVNFAVLLSLWAQLYLVFCGSEGSFKSRK